MSKNWSPERRKEASERMAKMRAEGKIKSGGPRKKKRALAEPNGGGRFVCCSAGTVTIFEADGVHGVTIDLALAHELRNFLMRALPPLPNETHASN